MQPLGKVSTTTSIRKIDLSKPLADLQNNCHPRWWKDPGLRELNVRLAVVFLGSLMFGYEIGLIGTLLAIPQWLVDLGVDPDDTNTVGLMLAGNAIGGLICSPLLGWLSSRIARKPLIQIGNVCVLVASIAQVFVLNPRTYVAMRILQGVGMSFVLPTTSVLINELAHPRQRGRVSASFGVGIQFGGMLVALIGFGTVVMNNQWSWRLPTIGQALFPAIQLCLMWIVPESPRWAFSRGEPAKGMAVLAKYHANGDVRDELYMHEVAEIQNALDAEKTLAAASSGGGPSSWRAFVRTPGNRKRVLIIVAFTLMFSWGGNSVVASYFAPAMSSVGLTDPVVQTGVNVGLNGLQILCSLVGTMLVDSYGRKFLMLAGSGITLAAFAGLAASTAVFESTGSSTSGYALICMLFLFQLGSSGGWSPLVGLYPTEICTFYLRAKGATLQNFVMLSMVVPSQYVTPVALANLGWRYYIVFLVTISLTIVTVWFGFPETKGRTVEQIAELFDTPSSASTYWPRSNQSSNGIVQSEVATEYFLVKDGSEVQLVTMEARPR